MLQDRLSSRSSGATKRPRPAQRRSSVKLRAVIEWFAVVAFALCAHSVSSAAADAPNGADLPGGPDQFGGYASDHIVIQMRPGVAPVAQPNGKMALRFVGADAPPRAQKDIVAMDQLLADWNISSITPAFAPPPANVALARQIGLDRYWVLRVPAGTDTPAMSQALAAIETMIESAEPDGIGGRASVIPDDPEFPQLWGLQNLGQTIAGGAPGLPGADISAAEAWEFTTGSSDIILAVIDSGVDPHVDLAGKILPGWYVIEMNPNVEDLCDHGTHVAGTAAAIGNNALGIAGVSWGAKVLPVRVLQNCSGTELHVANGLIYAADSDAQIANMSLQFTLGTKALHDAVLYADAEGLIMFAASGNIRFFGVTYPGKWPQTITVSATNNSDQPYIFSSAGPEVDIAAPGVDILSLVDSPGNPQGYDLDSGTSMATAHASGTACLMLSLDPTLTAAEIRQILRNTADDILLPGFDEASGYGRLNAEAALQAVIDGLIEAADLNGDGVVNGFDLGILLGNWSIPAGAPGCDGVLPCPADLNQDGFVNGIDLAMLLASWTI